MAEVAVGRVSDFDDGQRMLVTIAGHDVVVFAHQGRFHAFENLCPHMGGPVGEGTVIGKVESVLDAEGRHLRDVFSTTVFHLVCPWHGWEYDIETGVCAGDRRIRLNRYEVEQRGEDVYVVTA